jgi:hypothetical protein
MTMEVEIDDELYEQIKRRADEIEISVQEYIETEMIAAMRDKDWSDDETPPLFETLDDLNEQEI